MQKNLGDIFQQAQKVQEDMQKAQQSIAQMEIIGEAGAGMVRVRMNGKRQVKKVDIDPQLLKEDLEVLEDMLAAAVNDANHKLEASLSEKMSQIGTGIGLPPGFKLPF
ncbi:MAG: YbaB/EbfC family nucleoid-associated protein [Candidatus Eutrophobiaceae bacterium]